MISLKLSPKISLNEPQKPSKLLPQGTLAGVASAANHLKTVKL
jgi:hypothetical protein